MSVSQNQSSKHKIIVGIDYGTTFSGISYVTTDNSVMEEISIINSWPGDQNGFLKTPTRIAYARENPHIRSNKWGFEVYPKLISYSWTKLLLDENAAVGAHDDPALSNMAGSGMLRVPTFRQAAGVCEDFLHEVYIYTSRNISQDITEATFETTPMECWITLPAIWSDEAKDATLKAARNAGFGNRPGDEIFTIAEPEAAAIATLKKYSRPNALNAIKVNEIILICDCGGGTVDITTYVITQVSPRLEFDELHTGIGGKCGSTYIDRNLHTLLSKRFGSSFDNLEFGQKGPGSNFMISFETYKRSFGTSDERATMEIGPIRMKVPESEHYDELERMVKLTHKDMQSLFDPVVSEITSLVSQQVNEAKVKKNANIDRIILVGGFAESHYLNNALEEWCWRNGDLTLIRPEHPQAAVVRGAALRGLEGIAPRIKYARSHYGFVQRMSFREGIDPGESAVFDRLDNAKLCKNRIQWLISKGDEVVEGTFRTAHCCREYYPGQEMTYEDELYSSLLEDAPEYSTNPRAENVGIIKSVFRANFNYGSHTQCKFNPKFGKNIYYFSYEIQVVFGGKGSNLMFSNIVDGIVVSTAVIKFDQR